MNEHLITPCPVCYMEDACPHTPVRCQHRWDCGSDKWESGDIRSCEWCGRVERAKISWDTVKA
jgi:hypothetical protein